MVGFGAGRCLTDGSTSLTSASSGVYIGSLVRGCANGEVNAIAIGYNTYSCGSNTVNIGNACTSTTYLNGDLSLTSGISSNTSGIFGSLSAINSSCCSYFAGNVGIGTNAPNVNSRLTVSRSTDQIRVTDGSFAYNIGYDNSYFRLKNSAGDTHFVTNWSTGKVGIGTAVPAEKLTVSGNISASGNGYFACVIAGGYFEEKAASPTLAEYPTGSIVVIGKDGELELSTKSNDKKVFGVTKRGVCQPIVLGAEPVLVTGDINVGDFITTSDKAGHGKRALNTIHGSVIAQAMASGCGCSYTLQAMIRKM